MTMKRILYGSVVSPFVRKVVMVLSLKNMDYDIQELIPFITTHKQSLLKMNPLGTVPVYQEDGFIISDSSIICAYIDKKYPDNSIYPSNPESYV